MTLHLAKGAVLLEVQRLNYVLWLKTKARTWKGTSGVATRRRTLVFTTATRFLCPTAPAMSTLEGEILIILHLDMLFVAEMLSKLSSQIC